MGVGVNVSCRQQVGAVYEDVNTCGHVLPPSPSSSSFPFLLLLLPFPLLPTTALLFRVFPALPAPSPSHSLDSLQDTRAVRDGGVGQVSVGSGGVEDSETPEIT